MIEFTDGLVGVPCAFCGEPFGEWASFAVHEVATDLWATICTECDLVTEVGEGK